MRNRLHFTKASLEAIEPRSKQFEVWDEKVSSLALRVNPAGSKTFILCKYFDGSVKRIKIGRFPDITIEQARKQASVLNGKIASGEQQKPGKFERKVCLTIDQLFEEYYTRHIFPHRKRPKDYKALLELHLKPRLGKKQVVALTTEVMENLHVDIANKSGKAQANRVIAFASAMFNFGLRKKLYEGINPCVGITKYKIRSRDRFLSTDELPVFFEALRKTDQVIQDYLILSLLTGARKGILMAMKWRDIDFELKRWRVCEDESKNDEVNIYSLSVYAIEILKRRKAENEVTIPQSPFVFPGTGKTGHLTDVKKSFKKIKKYMNTTDLRIHDLRRTLASYMAINNSSPYIIGAALNHKSQSSTSIYARLSITPVADAVQAAGGKILEIGAKQIKPSPWISLNPYGLNHNVSFYYECR